MSENSDSENSHHSEQQPETEEAHTGTYEEKHEEPAPLVAETKPAQPETKETAPVQQQEPVGDNAEKVKVVDADANVVGQEKAEEGGASIDRMENYDLSELRPPSLIERLGQYAIVNNALTTYSNLKNSNTYLGAGLAQAENATSVALAYTAPVVLPTVQPILNSLDARFGVEQKAHHLLDTLEGQVANASQAISTTTNYIEEKKAATQNLVTDLQHRSYSLLIDRPVEQLLETIEALVDRLLPPNFEVERLRIPDGGGEAGKEGGQEAGLTKYERICSIGYQVPKRIVNLAQQKYPQLHLTEEQMQKFAFLVDLVQYAVDQIDLAGKRAAHLVATAQEKVAEGKNKAETQIHDLTQAIRQKGETQIHDLAQVIRQKGESVQADYVSPIRKAIEARLADIKDNELLSYAGVMAAIGHASELAKRQLYMRLGEPQNLMDELNAYLDSSKKMVLSFDKEQLSYYVSNLRTNAVQALSHILTLISSYAPKELVDKLPSYEEFSQRLDTWRDTILQRLAAIQAQQQTAEQEAKNKSNDAPVEPTTLAKEGIATTGESQ